MPKTHSSFRENFQQFWPVFGITGVIVIAIATTGFFFFYHGQRIVEDQLKDKLRSTASAAAIQFDGDTIIKISPSDTMGNSKQLKKVVQKLQKLREEVTNVRYAYIMRQTKTPGQLEFVADADLALSKEQLDLNKNSIIDANEEASPPGTVYDASNVPALLTEAFMHPVTDDRIVHDQWGWTISGYAPIRNGSGQIMAVLGIDMDATDYASLSESAFSPAALLLMVLAGISIGGGTLMFLWKRRLETLERLETERSGLLRLAFHQLGGPLTIINWSLEELEEQSPESLQRTIANIQEGVRRLRVILKTLKEADLVHSGNIEYRPESVSLGTILEKVVREMSDRFALRKQKINLELEKNITMRLDPKLIAGVAQELLTNAMDYSADGTTITVRARKHGRFAEFEIEDHGCGIPRSDLNRIFNEFTRGSNATRFKADGNGLGLYIVRGIINRTKGKVSAKSEEGVGTTITVQLPMA